MTADSHPSKTSTPDVAKQNVKRETPASPLTDDEVFMACAEDLARASKCVSKHVGCVIVQDGGIVATGVNGTPPGHPVNCCDVFDPASFDREEHHAWSMGHELHAEANAIARLARNGTGISDATMYVTLMPCGPCALLITATRRISRIVYLKAYDKGSSEAIDTLRESGIIVESFNGTGERLV